MLQRNESADYDGLFQMYTGTDDIQKVKKIPREQKKSELKGVNSMTMGVQVGQISAWNEEHDLKKFFPEPCSQLTGSAGEFFPQHR